jgi:hypothetical protein
MEPWGLARATSRFERLPSTIWRGNRREVDDQTRDFGGALLGFGDPAAGQTRKMLP